MGGKVVHIFISPNEGEPMEEVQEVRAIEQLGLEGDRYAGKRGAWSKSGRKVIRHVSLIEQEVIDKVNKGLKVPFLPEDTRRNIVVSNFPLNDKIGKEFMIWGVRMRGVELCDPCKRPSKLSGKPGFQESFSGYGGLRAEVLKTGPIIVGSNVSTQTYSCLICGTMTAFPHVCPGFYSKFWRK